MRVNIYAEEMTDRLEIVGKEIDGHRFTGLRFYLDLPTTVYRCPVDEHHLFEECDEPQNHICASCGRSYMQHIPLQLQAPFVHRPGDDDSGAVTFWGKRDLREVLRKALAMLDAHYAARDTSQGSQS